MSRITLSDKCIQGLSRLKKIDDRIDELKQNSLVQEYIGLLGEALNINNRVLGETTFSLKDVLHGKSREELLDIMKCSG